VLAAPTAWGQTAPAPQKDLTSASLEDLMNVEVTSASRKEQKLSEVAAAVFVITQEDIRRSGARNIPDLLRMVPGLDVAQINANTWAISARGFNLQFANKLLVMVDGRAVYTPLFGGVNWDTQDVPLEDIDRIEVIAGPGGTVWGSNAVNGVISIITRKAAETQGFLVSGGGGTHAQGFGTLQYGGKIKEDTTYRVFTQYQNNNHYPDPNGQDSDDGWHLLHGGFRADTVASPKDTLTIQGDIYTGSEGSAIVHSVFTPPENVNVQTMAILSGGNFLGRWNHVFSSRCDTTVQIYFDRYTRNGPEADETRNTVDIDFQNHLALGARHDLIWGAGYRHSGDQTAGTIDQAFVPASFADYMVNFFVQDEITLKPERWKLYAGTKVENSYFTGYDVQPSLRLTWTPSNRRTVWAAVSRASRTPTRRDTGLVATLAALPGPAAVVLFGDPNFESEHVIAYEAGYRAQPMERLSFGVATFINAYSQLESVEPRDSYFDPNFIPPLTVHPSVLDNNMHGTTEGVEAYANWKVTKRWTLNPGYSFLETHLHKDSTSLDTVSVADTEGSSPKHQAQLRSRVELPRGLSWDVNGYFVERLPAQGVASHTRLDTQLTWRFWERAELSVVGQNLLRDHHLEFNDFLQSVNSSQVKRSAYAKVTWEF
jgi:iron complex outermembrane receptor protein